LVGPSFWHLLRLLTAANGTTRNLFGAASISSAVAVRGDALFINRAHLSAACRPSARSPSRMANAVPHEPSQSGMPLLVQVALSRILLLWQAVRLFQDGRSNE